MALRTSKAEWLNFFSSIGISDDHATRYTATFQEQDVSISLLKFISDEELHKTYNVALGGHRLRILHGLEQLHGQTNTRQSSNTTSTSKPIVRHQAPQLQQSMNPSSFRAFVAHWAVYKRLVGIPPDYADAAAQLFSLTCVDNPQIRQTIADHNPNHINLNEEQYLEMLRGLLTSRATPETYKQVL